MELAGGGDDGKCVPRACCAAREPAAPKETSRIVKVLIIIREDLMTCAPNPFLAMPHGRALPDRGLIAALEIAPRGENPHSSCLSEKEGPKCQFSVDIRAREDDDMSWKCHDLRHESAIKEAYRCVLVDS